MDAVAMGFEVLVATAVILAVVTGAISGSLFWRSKYGLALCGLSSLFAYSIIALIFLWPWPLIALYWGLPALMLSFLFSYLLAEHLNARTGWGPPRTILAALAGTLIAGFIYALSFRLGLWPPILIALVANIYLIRLALRHRRSVVNEV